MSSMINRTMVYRNPDKSFDKTLQKLGDASFRVLCVCMDTLCEGPGKAKKGAQHWFTRMVLELRGLEYGARLERLKLMTLEERKKRSDLVELQGCHPSVNLRTNRKNMTKMTFNKSQRGKIGGT